MRARARRSAVVALLLAAALLPAGAAVKVYRCGNAYTDVPCPRADVIEVGDERSDADRSAAGEVARREAALAAAMRADRLSGEASATKTPRTVRARAAPRPAAPARTRAARRSRHEDDDGNFIAVVPAAKRGSAAKP